MTDIYVGQKESKPRLLLVLAVLTVAIGGGAYYWFQVRPEKATDTPAKNAPEEVVVSAEQASASPAKTAAPSVSMDKGPELLAEAARLAAEENLLEARDKALQVLETSTHEPSIHAAEDLLGKINIELVLTPRAMPEKIDYVVQPNDSLAALAKRFNTTIDLIRRGNRISGTIIRAGDSMRILNGQFTAHVSKKDNTLVLKLNDRFFKRYRVGTGQYGKTPVGEFNVTDKIPHPPWWRPDGKMVPYGDTNNVLGTHWLALSSIDNPSLRGYGIHGTWEPETIGKQASAGCIRLLNEEVEELFLLVPTGTKVMIEE